jgi:acetamidase/formamidase
MNLHRLEPSPDTVHWGYFDARLSPRLTIDSGDRVTLSSVSGTREVMPAPPLAIPPTLTAIQDKHSPRLGPHILTGPVAVRGAKPGQVLQVDIEAVEPYYDWGYHAIRPLSGALPHDYAEPQVIHVVLDRARKMWKLPWGHEVPWAAFFGVMGTAPPPAWGALSTAPPRKNGGNLDNKELVAGTTLYLPIFVEGALFSAGDGHGAQGDGEVSITAVETGLTGTFRLTVRDDMRLEWPRLEGRVGVTGSDTAFAFHQRSRTRRENPENLSGDVLAPALNRRACCRGVVGLHRARVVDLPQPRAHFDVVGDYAPLIAVGQCELFHDL